MADVVATPAGTGGNKVTGFFRDMVAFFHAMTAEMKRVTWPEQGDVRSATVAIIIFVLLLGLVIYVLDVALQWLLADLIPRLFTGR